MSKSKSIVHVPWTDEHLEILRREFPKGIHAAMDALPGHTECAIRTRASNMGIKLSHEALMQARGPNPTKLLSILMSEPEGLKASELAKRSGHTVPSIHNRLRTMKESGKVFTTGSNYTTVWHAEKPAPSWSGVSAPEFVKVASIFRVGHRVAAMMEEPA